ncbi:MAG: dihydropteroate synthase [Phycisphaerae bacterium]|nr:dihydropteroate synthase [Phycisphaerae bacterium]
MPAWRLSPRLSLDLGRPRVMAILNATPDSFADRHPTLDAALARARAAADQGADLLDVGGESTRPGAARMPADEQTARVVPIIRAIRERALFPGPISIDTTLAAVARAALDAGADAINDVSAGLEDAGMLPLAAERSCGLILMHRLAPPDRDRYSDRYEAPPEYPDVVESVRMFLADRLAAAINAGVDPDALVLDPGLGFGKSVEQNLALIRGTPRLLSLGRPVLSGVSRKSFAGRAALGRESDPSERLAPSLALSVLHLASGARLFRVHDVAEHVAALGAAWAVLAP